MPQEMAVCSIILCIYLELLGCMQRPSEAARYVRAYALQEVRRVPFHAIITEYVFLARIERVSL
jgi:hypothetical protein